MSRGVFSAAIVALSGSCLSAPCSATELRVPGEYPTILAALDAGAFGDTVLVAPGVYQDVDTRLVDIGGQFPQYTSCAFLKDGVVLRSEGGAAVTEIRLPDSPGAGFPAIAVGGQLDIGVEVRGFAFRSDNAKATGIVVNNAFPETDIVTVRECVFDGLDGGSTPFADLGVGGGGFGGVTVRVLNSEFTWCAGHGVGGLAMSSRDIIIDGCVFMECMGGGVEIFDSNPSTGVCIIRNSEFVRNSRGSGAGVHMFGTWTVTIEGCRFIENETTGGSGAGIRIMSRPPDEVRISNNVFIGNRSLAVAWGGHGGVFERNTMVGNAGDSPGGVGVGLFQPDTGQEIRIGRNIVYGTTVGVAFAETGDGTMRSDCNCFWENADGDYPPGFYVPGPNEIFQDPLFCDVAAGDYTLAEMSPCLPENNACAAQVGAFGLGCETPTWILLSGLSARLEGLTVVVEWHTSFEWQHDGFHVYRAAAIAGPFERVSASLIRGRSPYSFRDRSVSPGGEYFYQVSAVDLSGAETRYGPVQVQVPALGAAVSLERPRPNPFTRRTSFGVTLEHGGPVTLAVYDVQGRLVRRLANEEWIAGPHLASWDGQAGNGSPVPSGVYFIRLESAGFHESRRVVLLRDR
jgi:hypothetical protein